jgi:hypothetical protein
MAEASFAIANLADLGHGIHEFPSLDTAEWRTFGSRLNPGEIIQPISGTASTLLVLLEGAVSVYRRNPVKAQLRLEAVATAAFRPATVDSVEAGPDGALAMIFVARDDQTD